MLMNAIISGYYNGRLFCVDLSFPYTAHIPQKTPVVYAISGIYANVATDTSLYIGSTKNHRKRDNEHFANLRMGYRENSHLQNAYNKYGEGAFISWVLEHCDINERKIREQHWLDYYNSSFHHKVLFNIADVVDNYEMTEEHRQNLIEASKKRDLFGKNNPNYGRHLSQDARKRISEERIIHDAIYGNFNLGKKWSEERKLRRKKSGINEKIFKLISPLGEIINCQGINATGPKIGISGRGVYLLVNKKKEIVKGWKLYQEK